MGVKSKLDDRWEDGWKVILVAGPVNVKIQHFDGRIRVVHINRMQLHTKRPSEATFSYTMNEPRNDIIRHQFRNTSDLRHTRNEIPETPRSFVENESSRTEYQNEESLGLLTNQSEQSLEESLLATPRGIVEDNTNLLNETTVEQHRKTDKRLISSPINPGNIPEVGTARDRVMTESPIQRPQRNRRLPRYLQEYYV